jgi:hypothetical protein
MTQKLRLLTVVLMMLITSVIWAQPPIGGGDGGGIPSIEDIDLDVKPDIDIDVASEQIREAVSSLDVEALENMDFDSDTFSEMMDNFEVPEDWSDIELGDEMPSKEDIEAMADELPVDIDSLDIGLESSAEATSAIIGYASSMLSLIVTPLYAGEYGDSDIDSSEVAQETINQVYSQLDGDMQSLLSQADSLSGVTYWALLEDGLALIYTGDCDFDECTIDQEMVQIEITSGSAGAYAIYSDTVASSTDEAKALVQSTYPYLATIELSETESSYGTAFFAFDIDMDSQEVTAYYAGVYGADTGQSIVYAVSGIGDAYINMLLGG